MNSFSGKTTAAARISCGQSSHQKGGGGQVGPKNHGFDVLCRRISTQPWKLRISKKRRWSFFLWPWLQSPLRSRSALWDKFHCDVSVLCYVVRWDWWAQVWQIKTAANKRRQMDSEFMVDGECMWMLQRFLLSQLVNRLKLLTFLFFLFHFAQPNGS